MPNLTKEQIEKLMVFATKGKWRFDKKTESGMWRVMADYFICEEVSNQQLAELIAALPDIAQTALDTLDENKKLRAIVMEMQRVLENDPSLKLDIYGMAFYADTGIWPLFKSMPIAMNGNRMMSDEERSSKYMEWMGSIFKKPSKTP